MTLAQLQDKIYEIIVFDKNRAERIKLLDQNAAERCGVAPGILIADVYCTVCSLVCGFVAGAGYNVIKETEDGYQSQKMSLGEALDIELDHYYDIKLNKALKAKINDFYNSVRSTLTNSYGEAM